jgi:hypothetical protein
MGYVMARCIDNPTGINIYAKWITVSFKPREIQVELPSDIERTGSVAEAG